MSALKNKVLSHYSVIMQCMLLGYFPFHVYESLMLTDLKSGK